MVRHVHLYKPDQRAAATLGQQRQNEGRIDIARFPARRAPRLHNEPTLYNLQYLTGEGAIECRELGPAFAAIFAGAPVISACWRASRYLLSAVPIPEPGLKRTRIRLVGDVPNPINPPSGCHFYPRCPKAMERCKTESPLFRQISEGHWAACHLNDAAD